MIDILKVADGCEDTDELIEELASLPNGLKKRVYSTHLTLPNGGELCTLMTTSKDVHLGLGRLSYKGHQNLACIIIRALDIENATTGLFIAPNDNGALLATVSEINDEYTIHLSDAH